MSHCAEVYQFPIRGLDAGRRWAIIKSTAYARMLHRVWTTDDPTTRKCLLETISNHYGSFEDLKRELTAKFK